VIQDLRYAFRQLIARPGFGFVTVATLALGIGASTAIFSIVNAVLLQPLPYPHAEQLATWFEATGTDGRLPSLVTFRDWERQSTLLDLGFARGRGPLTPTVDGPTRVITSYVTSKFFGILGVPALLGQVPSAGEGGNADRSLAISYAFWQSRFGGDPSVIGRAIRLDDDVFTIVGVMPRAYAFPNYADAWAPISALPPDDPALVARDTHVDAELIARLKPGVSYPQAKAEMDVIAARLADAYPKENGPWRQARFRTLSQRVIGDVQARLLLFTVAIAALLLIVCVNLSSLQVARVSSRSRELVVRSALGASAWRISRGIILETSLLSLSGGILGLGLVSATLGVLKASPLVRVLPRADLITVDWRVIGFALVVCVAAALACALLPALQGRTPDLAARLREGGTGGGTGTRVVRLRSSLVAAEVALAVAMLIAAGLLVRTLGKMRGVELGFRPEQIYALDVFPPGPSYNESDAASGLYGRLQDRLSNLPGVRGVALTNALPLYSPFIPTPVAVDGRVTNSETDVAAYRVVSSGLFELMGISLQQGRDISNADVASRHAVAVVNQSFANRFLPGTSPLGHTVTVLKRAQARRDFGERMALEIIGVANDTRTYGPDQEPRPEIFIPFTLNPWGHAFVLAKIQGDATTMLPALRQAALDVEPKLPFAGAVRSNGLGFFLLDDRATAWLAPQRFNALITLAFAVTAILLTGIGIYGVTSQAMGFRAREAAVRMALGGTAGRVLRHELWRSTQAVLAGASVGIVVAWWLTGVMRSLLFGVGPRDALVFTIAPLIVLVAAILACYRPIRRATVANPVNVLRSE
jgi:putative ABC transport system permease protein